MPPCLKGARAPRQVNRFLDLLLHSDLKSDNLACALQQKIQDATEAWEFIPEPSKALSPKALNTLNPKALSPKPLSPKL